MFPRGPALGGSRGQPCKAVLLRGEPYGRSCVHWLRVKLFEFRLCSVLLPVAQWVLHFGIGSGALPVTEDSYNENYNSLDSKASALICY